MTSPTADPTFRCTTCGKQYYWKAEVAGRRGKCTCGAVTQIPLTPPPPEQDDAAAAAAPPAAGARQPGRSGSQGAVPPPYPTTQKPANGNAAAAGKSAPGVFGGFKRRIFGGRQDGK